jgi:hypothetical protein
MPTTISGRCIDFVARVGFPAPGVFAWDSFSDSLAMFLLLFRLPANSKKREVLRVFLIY